MSYYNLIYQTVFREGLPSLLSLLIASQAAHETNNFTSNVFLKCNNAFGYKSLTPATDCTGSPEGNHYKKYNNVADSALEVVRWIRRRQVEGRFPADLGRIRTANEYARLLKDSGYYGDSVANYTAGLLRYMQPVPVQTAGGVGIGTILLGIATIYLMTKYKGN